MSEGLTPQARPLSVLVVEHDEADAELNVAALQRAGFDVVADVVATRDDLAAAVAKHRYDVVLADYRLPNWTGMDVLDQLREAGDDTPVILITGTLGDERAVECVRRGIADYILKQNLGRLPAAVTRTISEWRARHELLDAQARMQRAEAESRDRGQRFVQLADNISEVFYLVRADYSETLYINRAYETTFGRSCQSLYDDPMSFLSGVHPDDRPRMFEHVQAVQNGETPDHLEFRIVLPDGRERVATSRAMPIRNERGQVDAISGVVLDITERRLLEEQYRQAQKMEAVGRLAGGVAHDFNNLLTVIMSYAEFVRDELGPGHEQNASLEQISSAATTAASLTRQLLSFSRQQVIQPRLLGMQGLVAGMERMLRRLIGEDIEFTTVPSREDLVINIDSGQFEQIIMNLVVNARDAMPTGGKLTIETARADLDANYTDAHWPAVAGPFAMVAVSDTGIGMDKATQGRIFEPFFTTKELGQGTGLGLATVYGIVKQSGGFIWVYSEPGVGSTFKVYFPLSDGVGAERDEPTLERASGTETVLLVEDAPSVRAALRTSLERCGYTVLEAPHGQAALDIAAATKKRIDVLVTDVVMPQMSGRQLAEKLTATRPEARVLFMSGYTDDAIIRHGVLASGMAFIQKPFAPDRLALKVREVLDATHTA